MKYLEAMKNSSLETKMRHFKSHYNFIVGQNLDFRKMVYLENNYGLAPVSDHLNIERAVRLCIDFFNVKGVNLSMTVEQVRIENLKSVLESIILMKFNNK